MKGKKSQSKRSAYVKYALIIVVLFESIASYSCIWKLLWHPIALHSDFIYCIYYMIIYQIKLNCCSINSLRYLQTHSKYKTHQTLCIIKLSWWKWHFLNNSTVLIYSSALSPSQAPTKSFWYKRSFRSVTWNIPCTIHTIHLVFSNKARVATEGLHVQPNWLWHAWNNFAKNKISHFYSLH